MVGLRQVATRSPPIAVKSLENMSMKVFGCISLMSAPAAKAFSPPASTMHPILSSASRSSTAAAISANTPNDSALSIFGRLSVIMPTAPLLSTMMCSNVLMAHPALDFAQCARWRGELQVGSIRSPSLRDCAHLGMTVIVVGSPYEHAHGRGQRQNSAAGHEDLPDQGGPVHAGTVVAIGHHGFVRRIGRGHRLGRRVGRCHCRGRR